MDILNLTYVLKNGKEIKVVADDEENLNILEQLIKEHFDNQFLDGEIELMINLLKTVEDELGMDITLLIDKLMRIQNTLLKDESVVESIEFY